jgi:hypothetical protein
MPSSALGVNIPLNILFSDNLSLLFSLNVGDQVSHPYKIRGKIIILGNLTFIFWDTQPENKRFCTE